MEEPYDLYLLGVKGDIKKALLESLASRQELFDEFLDAIDEEERIRRTMKGVADYLVNHSELFPEDPLTDVDVAAEVDVSRLQEDVKIGGIIAQDANKRIILIGEYKAWICDTVGHLRGEGFTLYKVKIKSTLSPDFDDLYEIDERDRDWESKDTEFFFQHLFFDPLLALERHRGDPGF